MLNQKRALATSDPILVKTQVSNIKHNAMVSIIEEEEAASLDENDDQPDSSGVSNREADLMKAKSGPRSVQ